MTIKARFYSAKEKGYIRHAAQQAAGEQIEDAAIRAQALWCAAALNAGYTTDDVFKIMAEIPHVTDQYGAYRVDEVADFALFNELEKHGINVQRPKTEI